MDPVESGMNTELDYREILSKLSRHLPSDRILDLPFDPMPHRVMRQLGDWARDVEERGDEAECWRIVEAVAATYEGNEIRFRDYVSTFLDDWSPHPDSRLRAALSSSIAVLLAELERVPEDLAPLLPRAPRIARRCHVYEFFFVPMLRSFRFLIDRHGFHLAGVGSFGGELALRFEGRGHEVRMSTHWENCSIGAKWIYGLPRFLEVFDPLERAGVRRSKWTLERVNRDRLASEELERRRLLRFQTYVARAARRIEKHCGAWIEELE